MNKFGLICLASILCGTLNAGHNNKKEQPVEKKVPPVFFVDGEFETVRIENLTQETLESYLLGNQKHLVIECAEGVTLPVTFKIEGDFMNLEPVNGGSYELKITKTCFIKCVAKKQFLFSTDLQNWKGFREMFTGVFGIAVNSNGPQVDLELELFQK